MLKNVEIQIFLPNLLTGGIPYILYCQKKYYIDHNTNKNILRRIPKNKLTKISINGKIKKHQYGFGAKPYSPSDIILIKRLIK